MYKIQIIYEFVIKTKNVRLYLVQPDSLRFSSVVNYSAATTESNATVSAATTVESTAALSAAAASLLALLQENNETLNTTASNKTNFFIFVEIK